MKKYFLIVVLLLVFSCKKTDAEPVGLNFYFDNPQPINNSELSKIPSKFQGLFMNSDSVFLNVKEDIILKESFYKFKFHKKDMDSLKNEFVFSNGKYIATYNNKIFDYRQLKDSIELFKKEIDTFFIFSNSQKAKRINGQLVLNTKDSIFWKIKLLNFEKNTLKINYIYSEDDLKRIDSVTKEKSKMIDSTSFMIKPTRKEFNKIISLKNLGEDVQYIRVPKSQIKNR
jgi:hypothetical protein